MITSKVQKKVEHFKNWAIDVGRTIAQKERSPRRLIMSCCVGVYIAFCPFVGFHTLMVFAFAWLFSLNLAVLFAVSCLINNPWTMVPIYTAGHIAGDWLLQIFGINSMSWNPAWLTSFNEHVTNYIGMGGVSLWSFLIGGNVLGLCCAGCLYPVLNRCLMQMPFKRSCYETDCEK
jgi:uncharacterized protein (DUF2062 family)